MPNGWICPNCGFECDHVRNGSGVILTQAQNCPQCEVTLMPDTKIEEIKELAEFAETWFNNVPEGEPICQDELYTIQDIIGHIRYLLQLVEQQQAEIERKDKFVAEWISGEDKFNEFGGWERVEKMRRDLQQSREEIEQLKNQLR